MTQFDCRGTPQICPPATFTCPVFKEILRESLGVTVPENIFRGMNVRLKPTGGLKFDGKNIVPDYDAICAFMLQSCGGMSIPNPNPKP